MPAETNYFTVNRKLIQSNFWLNGEFDDAKAWVDLIGLARWQDGAINIRGNRLELKRGQLGWSMLALGQRWRWSDAKVKRYLNRMVANEQISMRNSRVTTVITLTNYDQYQAADEQTTNRRRTEYPPNDEQTTNRRRTENSVNKDYCGSNATKTGNLPRTENGPERRLKNKEERISKYISAHFDKFWETYPMRNGRRVGKQKSLELFGRLSDEDQQLAISAASHYANEAGDYAKDPERFLKNDLWRDFIEDTLQSESRVVRGQEAEDLFNSQLPASANGKSHA